MIFGWWKFAQPVLTKPVLVEPKNNHETVGFKELKVQMATSEKALYTSLHFAGAQHALPDRKSSGVAEVRWEDQDVVTRTTERWDDVVQWEHKNEETRTFGGIINWTHKGVTLVQMKQIEL